MPNDELTAKVVRKLLYSDFPGDRRAAIAFIAEYMIAITAKEV